MANAASRAMAIAVTRLEPGDHVDWQGFLDQSATGTLFHDLRFLAYHPLGRHDFHHLVFRDAGRIVALLPGGICAGKDGPGFASPLGASTGGLALGPDTRLAMALELAHALVEHAEAAGWRGIAIALPPPIYNGRLGQLPSFTLAHAGFHTANRQLCPAIRLDTDGPDLFARRFRATAANRVRAARRAGATVCRLATPERFLPLLEQTYARHGTAPTHSAAELADLARRLPGRLTFHIAEQDGEATGGICVFRLNAHVATTFYICPNAARPKDSGVLVALADALDHLSTEGVAWLDLGPSADHAAINQGVMSFKESLGAEYHVREHMERRLAPTPPARS